MGFKNKDISRRKFVKSTLKFASISLIPSYVLGGSRYVAPSDKISIGVIGTGKQSWGLAQNFIKKDAAKVIAAADVDSQKLAAFKKGINAYYAKATDNADYEAVDTYSDYKELIERSDIDAVIVSTPDHWHALASIDAMKAGKDIYCEKPMAHTVYEGREMVNVAGKTGRVFQTGSMQRSWKDFRRACELVRNGLIGDVKTIKVNVGDPAIMCDLPSEVAPNNLDWNRWLGPAQMRPYNKILSPPVTFQGWPLWRDYWEFGGGGVADWGAHMFDIAQWGLGMDESGPSALIPPKEKGATRGLKMIYANGVELFHEDFGRGWAVEFIGSEGVIRVSREFLESEPANILEATIPDNGIKLYHSDDHYQDWLNCIKTRKNPVCDVETGHRTSTVCNIANIAYKMGRDLQWDPVTEKFNDKEANKWLTRKYRKPFKV